MSFEGKTVFVSGASGGLGSSIAEAFGEARAFVVVGFHVREDAANGVLARVRAAGGDGMTTKLDVTKDEDVAASVAAVLAARDRIDVLVHCAAIADDGPFALMDRKSWDRVITTNLTGTYCVCKPVSRVMLRQKSGVIVTFASISGWRASPGQANYVSSKGGIVTLTQTLAAELAPSGIRVNAVVPGLIAAGMVEKMPLKARDWRKAQIPFGRLGTAKEIASVVLFLASDAASYMTGQALVVDGGLSL